MNFSEQIQKYSRIIDDVTFPTVKEWKDKHPEGKVVGMFPVYTPYEIPHSMGMLPVGLLGAGGKIEIDHADSRIQSFVCSIARSTLELGLTGRVKDFDAFYFTSICDVARNLSGIWKTNFPDDLTEYIHFPQNMNSQSAVTHYRSELGRLMSNLEKLSSRKCDPNALRSSIEIFNKNRELCAKLYEVRRKTPWKLAAFEAYVLIRIGTLFPVEEHNAILQNIIPLVEAREVQPRDYVRVVIEGSFCEQPPLELLKVIEESGCYIVNDDLLLHARWFNNRVPVEHDPLQSLAESYIKNSVSSSVRHYGNRSRKKELVQKVREANAGGIIFCAPKFCEPALLDYVLYKDEMESEGIANLAFEYEEKMGVYESIRTQIETFTESVLFFS